MNNRDQQKLEQALAQANQGEKKKAYAELRRLQEKYPTEVNIWLWLAFTAPDPQTARQAIVEATRLNPGDASVRAAHRWLGDQERAHGIALRTANNPTRASQLPAQQRANPVESRTQQPPPAYYPPANSANQWQANQPPAPAQEPNPLMVAAGAAAVGALAGYALGQAGSNGNNGSSRNNRWIQTRVYGSGIVGRIIGSISLIIGLVITLAVCWAMRDSIIASLTFNRTEGTITKIGRETTPTDGTLLVIIVSYRDKQYRQYEERWQYKTSQTAYTVKDKVQVLYEPANPTNFRIDNFDAMWQPWMGPLGIGCLFLFFIPLICLIAINAGTVTRYGYRRQSSGGASSVSWGETDDSNGSSSVSWGEADDSSNGSSSVSWGNDDGGGLASFFGGNSENENQNGNGGSSFF